MQHAVADDRYLTIAGHSLLSGAVALLEPERSLLRRGLAERTERAVRDTILQAYARLDRGIVESIESSGLVPACVRGCSWCCHGVKVNVSIPEALAIAGHLAAGGHEDLSNRARVAAERRRSLNTDDLFQRGDPCPFLGHSGECSIYDVRPLACRRHCCLDATECESAVKQPKLKLPVQQHSAANAAGVMSALALAAASEDLGLDHRSFELATAVGVALQANAAQRWLSGELLFDAAVRPADETDRKIAQTDLAQRPIPQPSLHQRIWKSSTKKRRSSRK